MISIITRCTYDYVLCMYGGGMRVKAPKNETSSCEVMREPARAVHSRATVSLEYVRARARAYSRRGRLTLTSLIHLENTDYT